MEPHVNDTETPTVEPQAHAHVDETETPNLNKYYGLDLETLEALLSNDDIIDIQPISIDTSPIKKPSTIKTSSTKSGGVRTFFSKKSKDFNTRYCQGFFRRSK